MGMPRQTLHCRCRPRSKPIAPAHWSKSVEFSAKLSFEPLISCLSVFGRSIKVVGNGRTAPSRSASATRPQSQLPCNWATHWSKFEVLILRHFLSEIRYWISMMINPKSGFILQGPQLPPMKIGMARSTLHYQCCPHSKPVVSQPGCTLIQIQRFNPKMFFNCKLSFNSGSVWQHRWPCSGRQYQSKRIAYLLLQDSTL